MLITLYQYKHKRFVPVKEYYHWRVPLADELEIVVHGRAARGNSTQMPCPGCGKTMPRAAIRYDHNCDGTLTGRPIDNMRYLRNRRWTPARGEPDPAGCSVPTPKEIRAMYNADTNALAKVKRTAKITETVDDCYIVDYTTTTTADSQQSAG